MAQALRTAGMALAALALVALALAQFLPWATVTVSGSGVSAETTATAWELRSHAEGFGFEGDESRGWYDDEWDEESEEDRQGLPKIRWGLPFLVAGLAAAFAGLLLAALRHRAAAFVLLAAALLSGLGTALLALGASDLLESEQRWETGFYSALAGAVLGLVGSLLLLRRPAMPVRERIPGAP